MGCAERLGAAAVDGGRRVRPLRRQHPCQDHCGERWEARVESGFARDGVLVEKYNVETPPGGAATGHGGEYALQVGFGWTNGVQAAMTVAYPETKGATAPVP